MNIRESKFWNSQYSNYDARTQEAVEELKQYGLQLGGEGEKTDIEALTAFNKDDSGYRSSNLDYAKSYSGYKAEKEFLRKIETKQEKKDREIARQAELEAQLPKIGEDYEVWTALGYKTAKVMAARINKYRIEVIVSSPAGFKPGLFFIEKGKDNKIEQYNSDTFLD